MAYQKERVVVAMSGGVDSSVAALLLVQAGYEVVGVTMQLYASSSEEQRVGRTCCATEDVVDARAVCRILSIRHYLMNFEAEFKHHVIDYFADEYSKGRTPHPCIACNDRMKFDFLMQRATIIGANLLATGHYARIEQSNSTRRLLKGVDTFKDQSYVLFNLKPAHLSRLLLPVGGFTKSQIRAFAATAGLPVADKPDSQDICFIPLGNYKEFLTKKLPPEHLKPGPVIDLKGRNIGTHQGVHNFTIGQRKGIPVPSSGRPQYVVAINAQLGQIVVGGAEHLLSSYAFVPSVNWLCKPTTEALRATVKIRYTGTEKSAILRQRGAGVEVRFDEPMRAITPGQAAVFYHDEQLIGGGILSDLPADLSVQSLFHKIATHESRKAAPV